MGGLKLRPIVFQHTDGGKAPAELILLDQRVLPNEICFVTCRTPDETANAIRSMVVRGAPAIGITAAYGYYLGLAKAADTIVSGSADHPSLLVASDAAFRVLDGSRPTAVNLRAALDRVHAIYSKNAQQALPTKILLDEVLRECIAIADEDEASCRAMGRLGLSFVPERGARILHHCNTGSLATSAYGTALGVIRAAHERDPSIHVWVDETRPRLQGARLTAWECAQEGISHKVIVDSAAASVMAAGKVDLVTVGADRVAADGSVANKIGTYSLSIVAKHHGIPFIVVAPLSTIDLSTPTGSSIIIEERSAHEISHPCGTDYPAVTPSESSIFNPAFDITPPDLITAIVTECGIAQPPFDESIAKLVALNK